MQNFNVDISSSCGPLVFYAMQADSLSRFLTLTITDNGAAWGPPDGALWSVRFGAPQMPSGWYDTIEEATGATHPAVSVATGTQTVATVEIAEQALSSPGQNVLCVLVTDSSGYQIASWPIILSVQAVPGLTAPQVTDYYNLLTGQLAQALANAQAAAASATLSQSWAVGGTGTRPGEDTDNAEYYAQQAQQVSQGAVGYYETAAALEAAHPTGTAGNWAIVGDSDTIYVWDTDTNAWVDTGSSIDMSQYYTKTQSDARYALGTEGVANNAATANACSGNAETATKFKNAVSIGDASFDGSQDVTLAAMGAMPESAFLVSGYSTEGLTAHTNATIVDGGYVKIGCLVVVNVRVSVSGQIPGASDILFGFPPPLENNGNNISSVSCYSTTGATINASLFGVGDVRIFQTITKSSTLFLSTVYITGEGITYGN